MKKQALDNNDDGSSFLDQKSNMGLDWFTFQTQIRKLVMDLIEPTVKRAFEDHESVLNLNYNFDKVKNKIEEIEIKYTSTMMRMITTEDVNKKFHDVEKHRAKEDEKLWTELGKLQTATEVVRDRLITISQEAHTFTKITENLTHEIQEMGSTIESTKSLMIDQLLKTSEQTAMDFLEVKNKFLTVDEALRMHKFNLNNHNEQLMKQQVWTQTLENSMHEFKMDTNQNVERQLLNLGKEFTSKLQVLKDSMSDIFKTDIQTQKQEIMRVLGLVESKEQEKSEDQEEIKKNEIRRDLGYKKLIRKTRSISPRHDLETLEFVRRENLKSQQQAIKLKRANLHQAKSMQQTKGILQNEEYVQRVRTLITSSPLPLQEQLLIQRAKSHSPGKEVKSVRQKPRSIEKVVNPVNKKKQLLSLEQIWDHVRAELSSFINIDDYAKIAEIQELDSQIKQLQEKIESLTTTVTLQSQVKPKGIIKVVDNLSVGSLDSQESEEKKPVVSKLKGNNKQSMGASQTSKFSKGQSKKQPETVDPAEFQALQKAVDEILQSLKNQRSPSQEIVRQSQTSNKQTSPIQQPLQMKLTKKTNLQVDTSIASNDLSKPSILSPRISPKLGTQFSPRPSPKSNDITHLLEQKQRQLDMSLEEQKLELNLIREDLRKMNFYLVEQIQQPSTSFRQTNQSFNYDQVATPAALIQQQPQPSVEVLQNEINSQLKKFEDQISTIIKNSVPPGILQLLTAQTQDSILRTPSFENETLKSVDFEVHLDKKLSQFGEIQKQDVKENINLLTQELNQKIQELKHQFAEALVARKKKEEKQSKPSLSIQSPASVNQSSHGIDAAQVDLKIYQSKQDTLSLVSVDLNNLRDEILTELEQNILPQIQTLHQSGQQVQQSNTEKFKYFEKSLKLFESNIDQVSKNLTKEQQLRKSQQESIDGIHDLLEVIEKQNLDDRLVKAIKYQKTLKAKIYNLESEVATHTSEISELQTQRLQAMSISQEAITDSLNYIRDFEQRLQKVQADFEDKFIVLNSLELELSRGVKRNIRDKTDYMLQMQKQQADVDRQLIEQKDIISKVVTDYDKFREELQQFMRAYYDGKDLEAERLELNENCQGIDTNGLNTLTMSSSKLQPVNQKNERNFLPQVSKGLQTKDHKVSSGELLEPKKQSHSSFAKKMPGFSNYSQVFDFMPASNSQLDSSFQKGHNRSVDMGVNTTFSKVPPTNSLVTSSLQLVTSQVNWENAKLKDNSRLQNYIKSNKNILFSQDSSPIGLRALISNKEQQKVLGLKQQIQSSRIKDKRGSSLH